MVKNPTTGEYDSKEIEKVLFDRLKKRAKQPKVLREDSEGWVRL
jgi:hypothetical protein